MAAGIASTILTIGMSVDANVLIFERIREEIRASEADRQSAGLTIKLRLGAQEHVLLLEPCSLGHPRFIRSALTRLEEIARHVPGAHPVATAIYIGPQSAGILRSHGLGYIDLSGNCHLAFGNVLEVGGCEYFTEASEIQPYHLTTKEYDPDSQLYYFPSRLYDPTVGRFVSTDPAKWINGNEASYTAMGIL
jgi:RHS repeat-associated protein